MNSSASLDGPTAKVDRAKLHLRALNKSIGAFKRSKTHEFVSHVDPQTGEFVMHMNVLREPQNPDWGLMAGDMAHNLRSALDHLVWQLVILSDGKPKRQNQFPIISAKADYWEVTQGRSESIRDRMLAGVSEPYRTPIDLIQPYNAAGAPADTSLSHLSWLSNVDKHRMIHAAFLLTKEPTESTFDVTTPDPGGGYADIKLNWGRLEDGAEIMRVRPVSATGAPVNVEANLPAYIGFGDRGFPAEVFNLVFDWVERYVRSFEPVFDGKPWPGLPPRGGKR